MMGLKRIWGERSDSGAISPVSVSKLLGFAVLLAVALSFAFIQTALAAGSIGTTDIPDPEKAVELESHDDPGAKWIRLAGRLRFNTQQRVVAENWDTSDIVFITQGGYGEGLKGYDGFPTLGLAGLYDAPVLIVNNKTVPNSVKAALEQLQPKTIIIIGGTNAVPAEAEAELASSYPEVTIERLYGNTRQQTAVELYKAGKEATDTEHQWSRTAVVIGPEALPDGQSIGPYSYAYHAPVFYTGTKPEEGHENPNYPFPSFVKEVLTTDNFDNVLIIGGTNAVGAEVETWLNEQFGTQNVNRLAGSTRYQTNAKVIEYEIEQGMQYDKMAIVSGSCYADAIVGGAMCGKTKSVIALGDWLDNDKTPTWHRYVINNVVIPTANPQVTRGYVLGGTVRNSNSLLYILNEDVNSSGGGSSSESYNFALPGSKVYFAVQQELPALESSAAYKTVDFSDVLDGRLTYNGDLSVGDIRGDDITTSGGSETSAGQTVSWEANDDFLANARSEGDLLYFTFSATVNDTAKAGDTIPNEAVVTVNGTDGTSQEVEVKIPKLGTPNKTVAPAKVAPGGKVTYTVTESFGFDVIEAYSAESLGITISDELDARLSYNGDLIVKRGTADVTDTVGTENSTGQTISYDIDMQAVDELTSDRPVVLTFTFSATVSMEAIPGDTIGNIAVVTGAGGDEPDSPEVEFEVDDFVQFTVTYNGNGGTGTPASDTVDEGQSVLLPTSYVKTGATLVGWNIDGVTYDPGEPYTPTKNVTATAVWEETPVPETVTVTYNPNGGSPTPPAETVEKGESVTLPSEDDCQLQGNELVSWNIGGLTYEPGSDYTPASDVTATAVWRAAPAEFTVTYNGNGGTGTPAFDTVDEGESVTLPTSYTKTGSILSGWTIEGNTYTPGAFYTPTKNVTATAVWRDAPVPDTFTVTYEGNGGTGTPAFDRVEEGQSVILPGSYTRTGYTLEGWSIENESYDPGAYYTPTSDVTATALWRENEPPAPGTNRVTFDPNGGTGSPAYVDVAQDESITLPDSGFSRPGYALVGWTIEGEDYEPGTTFTPERDVTAVAQWEAVNPDSNRVTYNFNGGTGPVPYVDVPEGNTLTLPAADKVKRDGYTLTGWSIDGRIYAPGAAYTPTKDVTAVAQWQATTPTPTPTPKDGGTMLSTGDGVLSPVLWTGMAVLALAVALYMARKRRS